MHDNNNAKGRTLPAFSDGKFGLPTLEFEPLAGFPNFKVCDAAQ